MKKTLALLIVVLLIALSVVLYFILNSEPETPEPPVAEVTEEPVLYIALMTHLEGYKSEAENERSFTGHAESTRELATIFEEHDARVTFESSPEFTEACGVWDDNVLLELEERGHGVGVHADVGGTPGTELGFLTKQITEMKTDLEDLLGHSVLHVSGICSDADWVKAAIDAGYKFTDGTVGYCAMSMPEEDRPEEYSACTTPSKCHGVIPTELEGRLQPWSTSSGLTWLEDDPEGELVIFASSSGIKHFASGDYEVASDSELTQEDADALMLELDEALTYVEAGEVNVWYLSLSIGKPISALDEEVYHSWLNALQPYIDAGLVEWKTLNEVYEIYMES